MVRKTLFLLLMTTFVLTGLSRHVLAAKLILTTEEYPVLNFMEKGELSGLSTEILRNILALTKIEGEFLLYPWPRAYKMALEKPNTCVYSTTRTQEREPLFKWIGPLAINEWFLLGRPDSPKVTSLDEVKPYIVGGTPKDAQTLYLRQKGITVEESSDDRFNARNLRLSRIDFWAGHKLRGQSFFPVEGAEDFVVSLKVKEVTLYLACNRTVADTTINALNETLTAFKKTEDYQTLIDKYLTAQPQN